MATRCGIDLGTTYSAISWYDPHRHMVEAIDLDSQDGNELLRSAVFFEPGGNVVVGEAAAHQARQYPDRVIFEVKRAMGSDWTRNIDGTEYTAPQISAEILKALADDAEKFLGEPVDEVVVTVPAYFGDAERAATREAVELAGLGRIALLPEPVAAALAFAVDRLDDLLDKGLIVYDLGGGTFDVSLMLADWEEVEGLITLKARIVTKDGDRKLGGVDWDEMLADMVADAVVSEHGYDPRDDAADYATLKENVEAGKRKLSQLSSFDFVADLQGHVVTVSRDDFETLTASLLEQTATPLDNVLARAEQLAAETGDARLQRENIEVLLCGGSTRMPAVHEMVEEKMGRPPLSHGNPELLVTMGAAYLAYLSVEDLEEPVMVVTEDEEGGRSPKGLVLELEEPLDVGLAVGVEVVENPADVERGVEPLLANEVVIPQDSPFGEYFDRTFQVAYDGMTEIPIILYEGEDRDVTDRKPLAELSITGFPQGVAKGTPVYVRLEYDHDGIIRGEAEAAGQRLEIEIRREGSRLQMEGIAEA